LVTILFSNTLGTALGDFFAADSGLGYEGATVVFAGALVLVGIAYFFTKISRTLLFRSAFILTGPLAQRWVTFPLKPLRRADSISAASTPLSSSQHLLLFVFCLRGSERAITPEDLRKSREPWPEEMVDKK
jgi:uncharacterized membrane-anchored protein